jgi:hypothetical protein
MQTFNRFDIKKLELGVFLFSHISHNFGSCFFPRKKIMNLQTYIDIRCT